MMRKNILIIFALIMLSACNCRQKQTEVEGSWQGGKITVDGVSQAGSHIDYQLTVTGNAVQGAEILSAEGAVEKQNVTMTIKNK